MNILEKVQSFDSNILLYIQEHIRTDVANPFWIFYTHLGDMGILWVIVAIVLLCFKKSRRVGVTVTISLLLGFIVTNLILKGLVARTRPFYAVEGLQALISYPKDYSFPSGHSTIWFAGGTTTFLTLNKKYSFIFLILAIMMGFSRMYVGVHYPTDVLAGMIIGISSAIASYYIVKWIYNKKTSSLE